MRFRRYVPAVVICALLAVSGFAAAAIASGSGVAGAAQTGTTTLVTTVVSPPVTVTQTLPLVTLCHHRALNNGGTRHVTIRVSSATARAHRQHGDTVGRCGTARNKRVHRGRGHARKFH